MTRRQRWSIIATAIFPLVGMVVCYEIAFVIRGEGLYKSRLQIQSHRAAPIKLVACDTAFRKDVIVYAVTRYNAGETGPFWHFHDTPVRPATDSILIVEGRCAVSKSPLGVFRNSRECERFAIVQIEFEDGVTLYRVVELDPDNPDAITQLMIPADDTK